MHPPEERNAPPEQLIRCKLCEAVFYSKKAWESHNMLHSPSDLYINKEEDRKLAVARIDQVSLHFFKLQKTSLKISNQTIDLLRTLTTLGFRG